MSTSRTFRGSYTPRTPVASLPLRPPRLLPVGAIPDFTHLRERLFAVHPNLRFKKEHDHDRADQAKPDDHGRPRFDLSSARQLCRHRVEDVKCLLRANQSAGFDCPCCAWPESRQATHLEFCENGVKAIAHEATHRRVGREFFARHTLSQLRAQSHLIWVEQQGRLTEPLRYNRHSDRYEPIGWEEAFSLTGRHLLGLDTIRTRRCFTPRDAPATRRPARDPAGISRGLGCGRPRGCALYAPERRRGGVFLDR